MKKRIATLSAIIALLLIASPVMASAETIDVMALKLSDPVVYMNDQPMLDLTGLTLQFAGGATEDGALTQLFLDVFAGGENVNSAMLQIDENGVAGTIGGMTSAYTFIPVEGYNVSSMAELMDALENWTLIDDIGVLTLEFTENGFTYGDPETIEVDLAAGKASMTYVPMSADLTPFTYSLIELLENDALIGEQHLNIFGFHH